MVSARQASLYERRSPYASKRTVYKPGSLGSSASSIQSKALKSQFDIYKKQYDDGLISNETYLAFLNDTATSPHLDSKEVENLANEYRDTSVEINVEKMQAIYDQSDASEKPAIAQQIQQYYEEYAGALEPDTPAQSKFLQKAADWNVKSQNDQQTFLKDQRKLARAQADLEIAQLPEESVDTLQQKAQKYQEMALQALQDGDQLEANQLMLKAQQSINDIPVLQEKLQKEADAEARNNRLDYLRTIQNAYEDGEISEVDAIASLKELDDAAVQAGDTSLQLSINDMYTRLEKAIEKKGTEGPTNQIKEYERLFEKEDDIFNSELEKIGQITDLETRTKALSELMATYLYGAAPTEDDPEGWIGLMDRQSIYEQIDEQLPGKGYDDDARGVAAKVEEARTDLAQVVYQYQQIAGDNADLSIFDGVLAGLPEGARQQIEAALPILGTSAGLRLIEPNERGIPTEKFVDSITQADLDNGRVVPIGDGRYVRIQESTAVDRFGTPIRYAEYDGRIWVQDSVGDLVPASELAGTDETIASWYQTVQPREQVLQAEYERFLPESPPPKTSEELTAERREVFRNRPDVQQDVLDFAATGERQPATSGPTSVPPSQPFGASNEIINKNLAKEALDVVGPSAYLGSSTKADAAPVTKPTQDLQITKPIEYKPVQTTTPVTIPSGATPTPTQNQQLKIETNRLTKPGIPQTPIQSSGLKLDLPNFDPIPSTRPSASGGQLFKNFTDNLKSGVQKVGSFFGNLFKR